MDTTPEATNGNVTDLATMLFFGHPIGKVVARDGLAATVVDVTRNPDTGEVYVIVEPVKDVDGDTGRIEITSTDPQWVHVPLADGVAVEEDRHNNVGRFCSVRGEAGTGWRVMASLTGNQYLVHNATTRQFRAAPHAALSNLY